MGIMPHIAIIILSAAIGLTALAVLGVMLIRVGRRLHRFRELGKRDDDHVQYSFIINPSKPQADQNRRIIEEFCAKRSLTDIEFIETTLDKDGAACARQALDRGSDVVIAVGGDGTVRTVASVLSGTGHALGIVPAGTGNLFARNLGIPLDDIESALTVATSHGSRQVDVGRLTMLDHDDDPPHAFLIIAGIGFDAVMIDDTDPTLKKNISWLAYFVSGFRHLFASKYHAHVTITSPDGNEHKKKDLEFRTFMAGNCGQIPGFTLMPNASYDDGVLDFEIIDTSGGLIGWANLFGDVVHQTITGKAKQSPLSTNSTIDQVQGVNARIELSKSVPVQVDGDVLGQSRHIEFTVEHQSLLVRVPERPL